MVTGTPAVGFAECHAKVAGKLTGKTNAAQANAVITLGLNATIDDATDGLFNREDPTGVATDSPCGICGACDSDCTCM